MSQSFMLPGVIFCRNVWNALYALGGPRGMLERDSTPLCHLLPSALCHTNLSASIDSALTDKVITQQSSQLPSASFQNSKTRSKRRLCGETRVQNIRSSLYEDDFADRLAYSHDAVIDPALSTLVCSLGDRTPTHLCGLEENDFCKLHACAPPPPWSAKWPLGLDLLFQAIQHVQSHTLMRFFVAVGETCPLTHEQRILFEANIGTNDPRNVEAILSKQFDDFDLGLRQVQFADIFGKGSMMTQDGKEWRQSREMLKPFFARNRDENFQQIEKSVDDMIAEIPEEGEVDLQPLFQSMTLDTSLNLLFGDLANAVKSTNAVTRQAEFAQAFDDGQEFLTYRVRLGGLYWLYNPIKYRKTCAKVRSFIDEILDVALNAEATRKASEAGTTRVERFVLLEALLERTRDRSVLRDQCLSFLLAARDSTASCLTWILHLLVRHPAEMERLRKDISTYCQSAIMGYPSREAIKKMTYLDFVVKESLRLYPPFPINVRAAVRTTTLPVGGGSDGSQPCLVRKGSAVTWSAYAMHRRKDIFGDDAQEIRPERWAEDRCKNLGYAYIPFSGGKRNCMGQEMAVMQIKYTLVRLLQQVPEISLPKGCEIVPTGQEKQLMTLILTPAGGCRVHCKKL